MTEQTYITGTTSVQIARSIEDAVRNGRLEPGAPLPTVRALAKRLGVSPATVAAAYKDLRRRALLTAQGRKGTAVSDGPAIGGRPTTPVPRGARNLAHGNPDPALLPPLGPALRSIDATQVLYGADLEEPGLLALAAREFVRDGIAAESLAVVSGGMDGIERVLAAQLAPGDRVVVEDPGFTSVFDLVAALGLTAVPCAVDDAGLQPDALEEAIGGGAAAVIATPRAQNPTGAAFDEARAKQLRRVLARHRDVLLVEDDHAAAVSGTALHALAATPPHRWAFVRSLSKSFGPDLRLAVVAGDEETITRLKGRQLTGMRWVSRILQRLGVALWKERTTPARLKAAARAYAKRRNALIDALASFGIEAHGRSGLNVWVPVRDEPAVVQALLQDHWAVTAGSRFRLRSAPGIRVTISMLDPSEASSLAAVVAAAMRPRKPTASA